MPLEVDDLHVRDDGGLPAVKGISLSVRGGESRHRGVDGSGQTPADRGAHGLAQAGEWGALVIAGLLRVHRPSARAAMLDAGPPPDSRRTVSGGGLILAVTLALEACSSTTTRGC